MISACGSVSWQSKLLGNASLSSCESEYMGFSAAAQEVSFLRQLQLQMQGEARVGVPVKVLVDSQPALDIVHVDAIVTSTQLYSFTLQLKLRLKTQLLLKCAKTHSHTHTHTHKCAAHGRSFFHIKASEKSTPEKNRTYTHCVRKS